MSDVTKHYIVRAKREAQVQYESLRPALAKTMMDGRTNQLHHGSPVSNEEELMKNLEYFKVPSASVQNPHDLN